MVWRMRLGVLAEGFFEDGIDATIIKNGLVLSLKDHRIVLGLGQGLGLAARVGSATH